jgi:hypothetical protein
MLVVQALSEANVFTLMDSPTVKPDVDRLF